MPKTIFAGDINDCVKEYIEVFRKQCALILQQIQSILPFKGPDTNEKFKKIIL